MIYQKFQVIILILLMLNVGTSNVLFTDITINAGINYSGRSEGICVFDYNNDGWLDVFAPGLQMLGGPNGPKYTSVLYKNI